MYNHNNSLLVTPKFMGIQGIKISIISMSFHPSKVTPDAKTRYENSTYRVDITANTTTIDGCRMYSYLQSWC